MSSYFQLHDWLIVEEGFQPQFNRAAESIFSIGNGKIGQRANFEEHYSGDMLQGSYIAGVYYPDKTRVGWWKIGYPEYFAKVLNAANWIGIDVKINGEVLDLATCGIKSFRRELDMKTGLLTRTFIAELPKGNQVEVVSRRFLSMARTEVGAISYSIKSLNFEGEVTVSPFIDLDVKNEDANYNEKFWDEVSKEIMPGRGYIVGKTKKLDFHVCTGMRFRVELNGTDCCKQPGIIEENKYIANECKCMLKEGDKFELFKYAVNVSSLDHPLPDLVKQANELLDRALSTGFAKLLQEHRDAWEAKWNESDIIVEGDRAAQQGIRFNIFHLNQTYTGEDERLNIGPKGFTGEKYGGSTYWDTEAFALPFYLSTAHPQIAKNLLLYRYKHLGKAIENAQKLGFTDGAALYPMVTMNGEECHNEWEITFEEIHRNGAIAYAIFNYIRHTGDEDYMAKFGLEVLISISRFWSQRINLSPESGKFMILGVTGPNEYENNINNNWYTNTIASWTLEYTLNNVNKLRKVHPEKFNSLSSRMNFDHEKETRRWKEIIDKMYYPINEGNGVILQQDGFLDKDPMNVQQLDPEQRPLNQHWSWDRILRSRFIKQADVMQGIYLFEDRYDLDTIRRNFEFYENWTVHESSLSACIHSILAAKIGDMDKAYDLYLRTARLDLDDYNKEVDEGLHITSMAGTWLAIVEGFGGMRVRNSKIDFSPMLPAQWRSYSFHVRFRGNLMNIKITNESIEIINLSGNNLMVSIYGLQHNIPAGDLVLISR